MEQGETYRIRHLWVIISDPHRDADNVVSVNMTSTNPTSDRSCIINAGEHRFVEHETCINYSRAEIKSNSELDRQFSTSSIITLGKPVSAELLRRILDGAAKSDRIPLRVRKILSDQGLIPEDP